MNFKYILLLFLIFHTSINLSSQTIKEKIPIENYLNNAVGTTVTKKVAAQINAVPSFVKYELQVVKLPGTPYDMCIPPSANIAFCTLPEEKKLLIISLSKAEIIDSLSFKYKPEKMIMSDDGEMIYVATNNWTSYGVGPGLIYAISTSDYHHVTEMFPDATPQFPKVYVGPFFDMQLDENNSLIYLIDDRFIYVMNFKQNLLVDVIDKPQGNGFLNAFDSKGRKLFGLGSVVGFPFYMIDVDSHIVKMIQPDENHRFFGLSFPILSPDKSRLFVTVSDSNYNIKGMDIFDAKSGDLIKFIPRLTTIGGLVYNEDSTLAYLNEGEFIVEKSDVLDLSSLSKIGEINGGGNSGITSSDKRFFYSAKYGTPKDRQIDFVDYFHPDLTVTDLKLNYCFSIDVEPEETYISVYRAIAVSGDDKFVAITNPPLNSVSIVSNIEETTPGAVSLVAPLDSSEITEENEEFIWNSLPDVQKYHLQISDSGSFNNIIYEDSLIDLNNSNISLPKEPAKYFWRVRARNPIGWGSWSNIKTFSKVLTAATESFGNFPRDFSISQNFPNPFNPTTTINFSVPYACGVSVIIYDALGREVAEIVNEYKSAGLYDIKYDASKLKSGIYFYRMTAGKFSETKKFILLK